MVHLRLSHFVVVIVARRLAHSFTLLTFRIAIWLFGLPNFVHVDKDWWFVAYRYLLALPDLVTCSHRRTVIHSAVFVGSLSSTTAVRGRLLQYRRAQAVDRGFVFLEGSVYFTGLLGLAAFDCAIELNCWHYALPLVLVRVGEARYLLVGH